MTLFSDTCTAHVKQLTTGQLTQSCRQIDTIWNRLHVAVTRLQEQNVDAQATVKAMDHLNRAYELLDSQRTYLSKLKS